MKRDEAIKAIEQLFPPDENELGRGLLMNALCESWRELPENILVKLAQLNIRTEKGFNERKL